MKLRLTLLLLSVAFGINAQKQLQPYNYTITKDNETETIMIYASAEAVNSITFTLKNAKNEILKNDEGEDIVFKVFPFTETSFRTYLSDNIKSIKITENIEGLNEFKFRFETLNEEDSKTQIKIPTREQIKNSKKGKDTILEIRNIFQFFEALVITAFQYDDEPVSGLLKYKDTVKISKKNIEGLDTDIYFERQAKFIRNIVFDSKDYNLLKDRVKPIISGKYSKIAIDDFVRFLAKPLDSKIKIEENNESLIVYRTSYLWRLLEFHQNSKKGNNRGSRSLLKKHIKKQLDDWYNIYQLSLFTKEEWIKTYFESKTNKNDIEEKINHLKNEVASRISEKIKFLETEIDTIKLYIDRIDFEISYYTEYTDWEYEDLEPNESSLKVRKQEQENFKNNLISRKKSLDSIIKERRTKIVNLQNEKINISETIIPELNKKRSKIQNNINFLIANNKTIIAKIPIWKFTVYNIEIDFNDGFIEHIVVSGNVSEPEIDEISLLRSIDSESQNKYSNTNLKKMIKDFYNEPFVKEIYKDIFDIESILS